MIPTDTRAVLDAVQGLDDVTRFVFLVDPEEIESHYVRLVLCTASFRKRRWRWHVSGLVVAYGELREDALGSWSTWQRPLLWLRTAEHGLADPYDANYWPSEGVAVADVLARWPGSLVIAEGVRRG